MNKIRTEFDRKTNKRGQAYKEFERYKNKGDEAMRVQTFLDCLE